MLTEYYCLMYGINIFWGKETHNAEKYLRSNDDDGDVHGHGHVQYFSCVASRLMILSKRGFSV